MGMNMNDLHKEGSITAYLSLIIVIILSLIVTCVESARVSAAKVYGKSVLNTALQSTFGEYYLPLYDRYHIFALDAGYGNLDYDEEQLIDNITEVMEESLSPDLTDHMLQQKMNKNFLICNLSVDNLTVTERRTILDKNGEIFKEQALNYQKYSSAAKLLEAFLGKLGALSSVEEANKLIDNKLEVETTLYEIDTKLLCLVEYIDGFAVDENGIKMKDNGKPTVVDTFAKKIVNFPINQDSVQINNTTLYNAVAGKYVNETIVLDELLQSGEEVKENKQKWEECCEELDSFMEDYDPLDLEQGKEKSKLSQKVSKANKRYKNSLSTLKSLQTSINDLMNKMLANSDKAITCLEEIKGIRTSTRAGVEEYIAAIEEKKDVLEKSLYEELLNGTEEMNEYTDSSNSKISIVYNIDLMEETLKNNRSILTQCSNMIQQPFSDEESSYSAWENSINEAKNQILKYSHDGLAIDYSKISLTTEDNEALDFFKDLINDGITSLVVEEAEKLSKAKLPEENLVSINAAVGGEEGSESIHNFIEKNISEDENAEAELNLEQLGLPIGDVLLSEANSLMESILYISYIEEHFSNYLTENEKSINEQILTYEQEYILYGNTLDEDNLKALVTRIVIIRTIINLIHVLSDSTKTNTASVYAATLVGFTGLPFLISIVKYITLFIWAFEAALVETAALLQGKEVSLLTTKDTFVLEFTDIFKMSKDFILNKAKNYKDTLGGIRLGYQDYIRIFYLLQDKKKQYYRSLDLIQENIRYVYEDSFLLSRCLTEYEVSATLSMPEMFFSLPFITDKKMQSIKGYQYNIKGAVSY